MSIWKKAPKSRNSSLSGILRIGADDATIIMRRSASKDSPQFCPVDRLIKTGDGAEAHICVAVGVGPPSTANFRVRGPHNRPICEKDAAGRAAVIDGSDRRPRRAIGKKRKAALPKLARLETIATGLDRKVQDA